MLLDILIIDDEPDIRELISDILRDEGFNPKVAGNSVGAFKLIDEKPPSAIILDIWLQGSDLDGLGILEIVKRRYPSIPVIVISGHGTIETAVTAIKMGAYDYLEKPFTHDKLMIIIRRAFETAKLKRENQDLKSKVIDKTEMVGNSAAILKLKSEIERVALTSGRIMIHGQIGSGKELAARLIHKKSKRHSGPFIILSPTCMTAEKVQQELFGELQLESNGINNKRQSILEAANNGTLYIDEVGDLPIVVQTRLLKFLQDQILEKASVDKSIKLDIIIITATSKNLQNEIDQKKFREDLYYRLNIFPVKIPSLSDRKEDIPLLVRYFVKQLSKFSGLKEREFTNEALAALQVYSWPGNIRQLRNIIEWTLIMNPVYSNSNELIRPDMLPQEVLSNGFNISKPDINCNILSLDMLSMSLRDAREAFEKRFLSMQMEKNNFNISKTSARIEMERSALHRKLKLLGINTAGREISRV